MIQHVSIDAHTHDIIAQAARDEGMAYDAKLALIVSDWARAWQKTQRETEQRRVYKHALEEVYGVIQGGD